MTLEVYQITECALFSPGRMTFTDLALWDADFKPLTPIWTLSPSSPCGGSIAVDPEAHPSIHIEHSTTAGAA